MRRDRPWWAQALRVTFWVVIGLPIAALVLVGAALAYARTDAGRERVRRLALAQARRHVPGLDLGRIEGDYVHELALVGVDVRDGAGRVVVHADAIRARYALLPLLQRLVSVSELRVEGLRVDARRDAHGRLDLADLVRAPVPAAEASPAQPSRWRVHVDRVAVDGFGTLASADGPCVKVTSMVLVGTLQVDDVTRARLYRLEASAGDAGRLSLRGAVATAHGPNGTTLGDYEADLDGADVDPSRVTRSPPARLSFSVALRGRGAPLAPGAEATAVVELSGRASGHEIGGAHLEATATGTRWDLGRLDARVDGIDLRASGHGDGPRVEAADARVTVRGRWPGDAAQGDGDVSLHASGTWTAPRIRLTGAVRALRAGGVRVDDASVEGRLSGSLAAPLGHLKVDAHGVRVSRDAPLLDHATLSVDLEGGLLRVDGDVTGARARGHLAAHGRATNRDVDVTVDALSADFQTRRYHQQVSLEAPTRIRYQPGRLVRWDRTSVRGAGYLFTGEATSEGSYSLARGNARDDVARGEATLTLHEVSVRGLDAVDGDARLTLSGGRLALKLNADVPGAGARFVIEGGAPLVVSRHGAPRLAKTGAVTLHVDARCARLQALPLLAAVLERQGVTSGVGNLTLDVTGDVAHPAAKATFALRDVTYASFRGHDPGARLATLAALDGTLALDTAPGLVHVASALHVGDAGTLDVDVRAHTDVGQLVAGADPRRVPFEARLDVPSFDLGALAKLVELPTGWSGRLAAHAEVDGTVAEPRGHATAHVTNAEAAGLGLREIAFEATADGTRADASLKIAEAAGGSLDAKAHLDRTRDALEASATAKDLDVGFLRLLAPTLRETAGTAQLTASATGPLRAPKIEARLTIDKGRLGLIGQPTFDGVQLTATLTEGRVDVTRLELKSAGGTLSGKGWATLDGFAPRRAVFEAHAERFLVAASTGLSARLKGDFAFEAALRHDVLEGKVSVPHAELRLPSTSLAGSRNLQSVGVHDDVRFVDERARAADARARTEEKARTRQALELRVHTGRIYVRSSDLDLELDSDLEVRRASAASQVTLGGGIHVRRGRITIQGQRFDVRRADVTFDGSPDPALAVRVERQFPDALVVVEISGTAKKPSLRLTSDPPVYDEAQIISLVLTGQRSNGQSPSRKVDAAGAVTTAVLGRLASGIAPQVGIDVLRVQNVDQLNAEGLSTGATDTRVEVGKFIGDRIYLSYAHVFGANELENQNEARVEYRLSRRWILESVFGDAGVGSLDALWTHRY